MQRRAGILDGDVTPYVQIALLTAVPPRYHRAMDHDNDAPRPIPAGWLDALAESDADLEAGRIVPEATVRGELRASIARIEARLADADQVDQPEPQPSTAPSRP